MAASTDSVFIATRVPLPPTRAENGVTVVRRVTPGRIGWWKCMSCSPCTIMNR